MSLVFKTKAQNLDDLSTNLKSASILPLEYFSFSEWQSSKEKILERLEKFKNKNLVVRSSSQNEDSEKESLAGHFTSILNVKYENIISAVEEVLASYKESLSGEDQVLVQPMLENVENSGVVFSRDISNASHYYVINYDEVSGSTDSVTSGEKSDNLSTLYIAKSTLIEKITGWQQQLVVTIRELEELYDSSALDVEFGFSEGNLYVFQVRPLILANKESLVDSESHRLYIRQIKNKVTSLSKKFPYLAGDKSIFGVMPDWNPAEIIGIRPRPFALSLYKELITDGIWAESRHRCGYRNLHSFPLIVSLGGIPYVDVRVSFNSFIPKDINDELANKLVNHYLDALRENPSNHDKVEFEIIYSCFTFDLEKRALRLLDHGFNKTEVSQLTSSLTKLTNNIIDNHEGLWKQDFESLKVLQERQKTILNSDLNEIEKNYWLIEDCKKYGTLPFAGLARAGFIAVQLLNSMVSEGILSQEDYDSFMNSLRTISSDMNHDFEELDKENFIEKYGHLRPGTYDILTPSYKEDPDRYFQWGEKSHHRKEEEPFVLSDEKNKKLEKALKSHGLNTNIEYFFDFLKGAIEGREYSKFLFTKSLSASMDSLILMGEKFGFTRDELSYADIKAIHNLYSSTNKLSSTLNWSIGMGKKVYNKVTSNITLPPLIIDESFVENFELPKNQPNFITLKQVTARITNLDNLENLNDSIVMIPSADPGFDWIFTYKIKGFVTMYGGANSHMAIRAGELSIPAIIGAGELMYKKWSKAKVLTIDCSNKKVEIIQ
ncbi:MAG: hypothetical protein BM556_08950 [Bacteriovorax sp. MedPE-SWde]|nr:MAG: hypothetical protein BM556_08950 [Bacteriovorax sp. MedPE-SWde]